MTRKTKKINYESLTIRQAQHKNCAVDAQLGVVCKFIQQEKHRRIEDIERVRRQIRSRLASTLQTTAVPVRSLVRFQGEKGVSGSKDVCMHIAHCYLARQEKNKELWHQLQSERGAKMVPTQRPVVTPDHLHFIHKAFPETFDTSVELDWMQDPKHINIYEYGRAGHDMKCMSTRAKPVGGYATRGPLNFRFAKDLPEFAPFMEEAAQLTSTAPKPDRKKRRRKKKTRNEEHTAEHVLDSEDRDEQNKLRLEEKTQVIQDTSRDVVLPQIGRNLP